MRNQVESPQGAHVYWDMANASCDDRRPIQTEKLTERKPAAAEKTRIQSGQGIAGDWWRGLDPLTFVL